MLYKIIKALIKFVSSLIARVDVSGLEKIPEKGACIAAANHIGRLEVLLVYAVMPRNDTILIVAEKYRKNALFRWIGNHLNVIWVDRFNADLIAVREVIKRLGRGQIFVVAPEGTRSPDATLQPGLPGTAYLASKSQTPIFPAGVIGTEDKAVLNNLKKFRRSPVKVIIGDPFTLLPLPRENRDEVLANYTDEIMCRIAALLPPEYRGVYAEHPRLIALSSSENVDTGLSQLSQTPGAHPAKS